MMKELKELSERTAAVEAQMASGSGRASALQQPLGGLATTGLSSRPAPLQGLVQQMPPPRSSAKIPLRGAPSGSAAQAEAQELEEEQILPGESAATLTQAVLMQSQALSSLVSQLASGEAVDTAGGSLSFSNKGAQGRMRLQQELAQHKGVFFDAVFSSMVRRMQPALPSNCAPAELATRGVTASQYVERYGGYGRCTSLKVLAAFPRWILATRTGFSAFLPRSFHIKCCGTKTPASVVFPLPLADIGLFESSGPHLSAKAWTRLVRKRARHTVIMALNYVYGGPIQDQLAALGRRPNAAQTKAHRLIWSLIATCQTPGSEDFSLVPGRSGTEFIARLGELENFAADSPQFQLEGYGDGPVDFERHKVGEARRSPESLPFEPYSNLNSERLKLVGNGSWPLADFLEDELWLPFVERKILHHDLPLRLATGPNLKIEDPDENLKLALLWDSKGLLALSRDLPHKRAFTRIFNARKDDKNDRQIGDRRFQNFCERGVQGPSKFLPGGYLLTGVHVPRGCIIRGSITDRKDFYHQAAVSSQRASSNCLPFAYKTEVFSKTKAWQDLLLRESPGQKGREDVGDKLGFRAKPILQQDTDLVYPNFASLLQGDHLGVEFALSGHSSLLRRAGLLTDEQAIHGGKAFPEGPVYQGLCIDDYFVLAAEPSSTAKENSQTARLLDVASKEYDKNKVLGSPEKDVRSSRRFKVVGAEINSSEEAVSKGLVLASAPVAKRLSLAVLTFRVARLPIISVGLASRLAGNWTSIFLFRRCLTCLLSNLYEITSKKQSQPGLQARQENRRRAHVVFCL